MGTKFEYMTKHIDGFFSEASLMKFGEQGWRLVTINQELPAAVGATSWAVHRYTFIRERERVKDQDLSLSRTDLASKIRMAFIKGS